MSELLKNGSVEIREVWNHNLEHEFALIHDAVDKYPYIAMDTEFPGVVLRTVDNSNLHEFNYQNMKANVDILKLIQLGLTFSDENGNLPTCGTCTPCIWQFNFKEFNVSQDIFNNDSIQMLRQPGIDFKKNELGIDVNKFAELLMSSGVVLNDEVQWITFHSSSDFGYLLKLLTCKDLPETQAGFFELFSTFFPVVYDIKHMIKYSKRVYGGLDTLAGLLGIERVGISHQAGSDSLLTYHVFKKLKDAYINGHVENYSGILFGLGVEN